jgi:dolichyl-phosphate beta-glucosyltransferase
MEPLSGVSGPAWLEIIVPARNEEARLSEGLSRLCAKAAELPVAVDILVVDNASTDRTADIVLNWPQEPVPVRLIRADQRGKGAAVRAGLLASTAPYVGYCDADMAADLSALDSVIDEFAAGHQVVIGSRAHSLSKVEARHSPFRKLGAALFRSAAGAVSSGVGDTQCGFKFFSGPLVRKAAVDLTARGFAFDIELIARCRQLGADVIEIPVSWRDMPGSTFSVWRHSLGAFTEVGLIWLALRSQSTWNSTDFEVAHAPLLPRTAAPITSGEQLGTSASAGIEAVGPS